MKKKLEERLRELAQRIASEESLLTTAALKNSARELYENLLVLEYLERQVSAEQEESVDSKTYREQNWFDDPQPVPQPENKEELIEPAIEKIKDIVAQMPEEAQNVDELLKRVLPEKKLQKNDLEEFASHYKEMPVFERKEAVKPPSAPMASKEEPAPKPKPIATPSSEKPKSINDSVNQGFTIGLNDRLAFTKHLFDGNADDFTRVISQINTLSTFEEAQDFINGKVKPDYNYWLEKEEVADRFLTLVEKKFN